MIQSLLVYIGVSLILFFLGWHLNQRESQLKLLKPDAELPFWSWEIVVSIIVVTLMMGLRFQTGSDYDMYLKQFQHVRETGEFARVDLEIGFYWITRLFAASGLHFAFYFGFWGLIQAFALYFGLRHHKHLLPWVGMILILGPYVFNYLTFMRQWTISMMLVAMIPLIEQRKFIPYFLLTLLAITIHKSAWLLIVFYFLPFIKVNPKSPKVLLIIFVACVILGIWPIWFRLLGFVPDFLDFIGYHKYGHHLVDVIHGQFRNIGWGPLHLISLLSSFIFIYFYPQVKSYFKSDKLLPIFFLFAFVGTCYENIMMNTHHSMQRPAEYLYIFIVIMIAYCITYLIATKQYLKATVCCLLPCSYTIIDIIKVSVSEVSQQSLFYHFIF